MPHDPAIIADLTASQCALPESQRAEINPAYANAHTQAHAHAQATFFKVPPSLTTQEALLCVLFFQTIIHIRTHIFNLAEVVWSKISMMHKKSFLFA